jgi:hypothetical protein
MKHRTPGLIAAFLIAFVTLISPAAVAQSSGPGFQTERDPMLVPAAAPQPGAPTGVTTEPILTVGDTLPGGYRFESIPDGISLWPRGNGRLDVFVNHETSTVPFPYIPGATGATHSLNDFDNSQLSQISLHQRSLGVLTAKLTIESDDGYHRFCSNFLATDEHGFDRPMLFLNEEGIDWVNRSGRQWPPPVSSSPPYEASETAREIGTAVAYDVRNGKHRPIWGMGRHNHENTVAIPGYDEPVLLSGDDAFVSSPAQSQLYMYRAESADDVWNDDGDLYAFVADTPPDMPDVDSYFDFAYGAPVGTPRSVSGKFVRVPDFEDDPDQSIAHGRTASGRDVVAGDFDYPAPPTSGWQRSQFLPAHGVDGPQWVLEHWGDLNNVFEFIRVEDIAYDKRPGMENIVYIIDSGAGGGGSPSSTNSTNGRIWRMVLDKDEPTIVRSLSVLVDGEDQPTSAVSAQGAFGEIRQPDNLDTTANGSLLVQEDPGSRQQFPAGSTDQFKTTARTWQVDLPGASYDPLIAPYDALSRRVVAVVDQSLDEELGYDLDPPDSAGSPPPPAFLVSPGNLGAWESSGIIDASSIFGSGAFLVTVQAHTLAVDWEPGDLNTVTTNDPLPDFHYKREGGQLLLLRVPGA